MVPRSRTQFWANDDAGGVAAVGGDDNEGGDVEYSGGEKDAEAGESGVIARFRDFKSAAGAFFGKEQFNPFNYV